MPIVIGGGGASTATGPTLLTLRNRLADEFGMYLPTTVSTTATLGDLKRVVLADELRDDEDGYENVAAQWLYARASATQRRVIRREGPMGAAILNRPYATALAAGSVIEATSPLPMKRHDGVKGLQECLLEGLARQWVEALITLTGNGTRSYSLAAYPWLTRYEQMRGVYDSTDDPSDVSQLSYQTLRLSTSGVTRTLITERIYDSATTFYLAVAVRADKLVYDGSSWSYVTSLANVNDTYQFAVPEEWAVTFGMVMALRYLDRLVQMRNGPSSDDRARAVQDIKERRRHWVRAANRIRMFEFPKPVPEPRDAIVTGPVGVNWP